MDIIHYIIFCIKYRQKKNQEMQLPTFNCQKHKQKIQFFCTANQWHFIPLCPQCIPDHTQNHPKNFKVTLQSYNKVVQISDQRGKQSIELYRERLQKVQQYLSGNKQPQSYTTLQQTRTSMLNLINTYFDSIKTSLDQKLADTLKFQQDLLTKLKDNIQADIKDLQQKDDAKQIQQWAEINKRLYFKDGVKIYLDQIDQVLKDHHERVYARKDLEINLGKLVEDVKRALGIHVYVNKEQRPGSAEEKAKQTQQQKQKKEAKKQPKIVIKPKICKNCNAELQYISPLKKHLYCPTCGNKQRNYVAKKP